mmetsp:Transcript_15474/g.38643  ORF Transcript_15474/g.38643 Transcript_15474/m.38643 type:complete len:231 (-) Transcript_15474:151-843(-)
MSGAHAAGFISCSRSFHFSWLLCTAPFIPKSCALPLKPRKTSPLSPSLPERIRSSSTLSPPRLGAMLARATREAPCCGGWAASPRLFRTILAAASAADLGMDAVHLASKASRPRACVQRSGPAEVAIAIALAVATADLPRDNAARYRPLRACQRSPSSLLSRAERRLRPGFDAYSRLLVYGVSDQSATHGCQVAGRWGSLLEVGKGKGGRLCPGSMCAVSACGKSGAVYT